MQAMTATGQAGRTGPSVVISAVDQPQPRPHEVLVKVEAYSVNVARRSSWRHRARTGGPERMSFTVKDGKITWVREYADTHHVAKVLFPEI